MRTKKEEKRAKKNNNKSYKHFKNKLKRIKF